MKRWQMTVGLAGLAIGALALAPRLFHHFPTPEPPPAPPEQPAPVPAVAAGHLVVDAHTDQGLYLRGDTTDHFVTIEVSAPADLGTGARRPVDLAVVLDTSGSMRDEIETAKAATLELARSLSPNDTLSVVAFAGQARVVRRAQGVASGPDLVDTLEGLYAHGGTNLFEGLELGGVTLARRPGALQRVVLLSDGKATEGELRPEAFARLASDLASRGTSVSTVGLGATYNEDLMARIADLGGGRYDDIAAGHELMSVFQEEVNRSATLIASDSRVTVTLPEGMEPVELLGWSGTRVDGGWSVYLGDVYAGERRKIVARVRTTSMATGGEVHAVAHYQDAIEARAATSRDGTPVALTTSLAEANRSVDPHAKALAQRTYGNWYLEMATRSYAEGRQSESLDLLDRGKEYLERSARAVPMPDLMDDLDRFEASREMVETQPPTASGAMRHMKKNKETFRAIAR